MIIVKCKNCNATENICRCEQREMTKTWIDPIHLFLDYYANQFNVFNELDPFMITKKYFIERTSI